MPVFQYLNPPRIVWGPGSAAHLADELNQMGSRWPAVVTTRSLLDSVSGLPFATRSDSVSVVSQHAPIGEVTAAIQNAADADGVVSYGGGSAVDAGKMVALALGVPHLAIPTTLSVAELAPGAGFTDERGDKAGKREPGLLPRAVIYDPKLTLATPEQLWLSSGIRALDHAVEGFLGEGEHPFNDVMALEAIRRLFRVLPATKADPQNVGCRGDCQLAAWFSFTLPGASASGLSHVMGKQIGARHGIPHGVTSCLLLPHVMRFLATKQPARVAALGVTPDEVEGLIRDLGLPQHIAAYGIGEPELRRASGDLADKYPAEDLLQIYLEAL
jgi:maleylacetate reductase